MSSSLMICLVPWPLGASGWFEGSFLLNRKNGVPPWFINRKPFSRGSRPIQSSMSTAGMPVRRLRSFLMCNTVTLEVHCSTSSDPRAICVAKAGTAHNTRSTCWRPFSFMLVFEYIHISSLTTTHTVGSFCSCSLSMHELYWVHAHTHQHTRM